MQSAVVSQSNREDEKPRFILLASLGCSEDRIRFPTSTGRLSPAGLAIASESNDEIRITNDEGMTKPKIRSAGSASFSSVRAFHRSFDIRTLDTLHPKRQTGHRQFAGPRVHDDGLCFHDVEGWLKM